jgi:hypothetical protein
MSVSKSRSRTAAQRAASRANGRKSTGPKTLAGKRLASLNGLEDGARTEAVTRPMWQGTAELGENLAQNRSLLRDVRNSYPPQSSLELRMCEDIPVSGHRLGEGVARSHEFAGVEAARLTHGCSEEDGSGGERPREGSISKKRIPVIN